MSLGRPFIDFFHLSRGERSGMIVLAIILAGVLCWHAFLPRLVSPEAPDMSGFEPTIREFRARQAFIQDSLSKQKSLNRKTFFQRSTLTPFPFDPNNLPIKQWKALGLSEKQVRVIKNYERKGGTFNKPGDLKKIYSISEDEYKTLLPYIRIARNKSDSTESGHHSNKQLLTKSPLSDPTNTSKPSDTAMRKKTERLPENIIVSINVADTLDLQRLPGIGPVFSRRICSYRNLLGGFFAKDQLLEVYGMDSLRFFSLKEHIFIDTTQIAKFNINRSPLKVLMRHPYIDFALAKMIVTERGEHGSYASPEEVRIRLHLPGETFLRIAPYIEIGSAVGSGQPEVRK
jgi:DNA uptake protein ComE-like DNA-binding protein